jgi:hypothetical protein
MNLKDSIHIVKKKNKKGSFLKQSKYNYLLNTILEIFAIVGYIFLILLLGIICYLKVIIKKEVPVQIIFR